MLWVVVGLAGVSLVMLIVGGVAALILYGHTQTRQGPQVGKEVMNDVMNDPTLPPQRGGYQKSFFVGQGIEIQRSATISFATLKQMIAAGNCLYTLVALTAIFGFVGVLFFSAIAVLFLMPNLVGLAFTLPVFYLLVRMLIDFIRA